MFLAYANVFQQGLEIFLEPTQTSEINAAAVFGESTQCKTRTNFTLPT
jgi:hypothetical protein